MSALLSPCSLPLRVFVSLFSRVWVLFASLTVYLPPDTHMFDLCNRCVRHVRVHVYVHTDPKVNHWIRSMLRFQLDQHTVMRSFDADGK